MSTISQKTATAQVVVAALLLCNAGSVSSASASEMVSIVSLIAHPEKYDGNEIVVTGFLALDFEGSAIYLHQDDYAHSIFKNGLWYAGDAAMYKRFARKYVNVQGTFDAKDLGHLGLWSGAIKDVKRIWESAKPDKHEASDHDPTNHSEGREPDWPHKQIDVVVTGEVVPAVVEEGRPIPLTVRITNNLKGLIRHQTFRLEPVDWNGETINVSLVDIYRNGRKFNLHLARPEINAPVRISGLGAHGIAPGETLEVKTDARKWKLRDGWLPGRYEVIVRVDNLLIDDHTRADVLSDWFTFEIEKSLGKRLPEDR